jgi:hypothetical protein
MHNEWHNEYIDRRVKLCIDKNGNEDYNVQNNDIIIKLFLVQIFYQSLQSDSPMGNFIFSIP